MPFFDQLSYVQKAKNFWDSVAQRKFFNPLNLEPSLRPPGTILMSYPLGFSENTHAFYFRSIFLPITFFISALWIVAKPLTSTVKTKWLLVSLCLALSTLPLFYQFEPDIRGHIITQRIAYLDLSYWGLVDTFLASLAALSTALVVRGIRELSVGLSISGIFVSAFCLLVKPAGTIVMAIIFLIWVAYLWAIHIGMKIQFGTNKQSRAFDNSEIICFSKGIFTVTCKRSSGEVKRYVLVGLSSFAFIYGLVMYLCFTSAYLSFENIAYGKRALEVFKQEWVIKDWWPVIKLQIHSLFGWHWLLFLITACVLRFGPRMESGRFHGDHPKEYKYIEVIDLLSALGVMLIGLWFSLVTNGLSQSRYLFPFALISFTLCFPRLASSCTTIPDRYTKVLIGSLLCPFLLVLVLLIPRNAPVFWQRVLGVNLTSGSLIDDVRQAKSLVGKAKGAGRDLVAYFPSISSGVNAIFVGVGHYVKLLRPDLPSFSARGPIDWVRESTLRFREIASSDYLVFEPILDSVKRANILAQTEIPHSWAEIQLFKAWLTMANEDDGLEVESEKSLRLVKVVDRLKFGNALDRLKSKYSWRELFLNANPDKWIDRKTPMR